MIVVKMMGGLGNQMFQYATGRRLALRHKTKLVLDTSGYENMAEGDTPREFELDCYNIVADIASEAVLQQVQPPEAQRTLADKVLRQFGIGKIWQVGEGEPKLNPLVLNASNNTYLTGWWQNEAYFADVRDHIVTEFTPKTAPSAANQAVLDQIKSCNAVALHVRRGDYVSNKNANTFHGLTPLEYYRQSVAHIREKVQDPRFFVFSDDLDWCRQNFDLGQDAVFVDGNGGKQAFEDIRLMQHCKHNIIANSSFSWWGAWLNNNPEKIVIAPKAWFQDPEANSKTEIVPSSWVRI